MTANVALFRPLAQADRALVVEVLIDENLAVLDLGQQELTAVGAVAMKALISSCGTPASFFALRMAW